MDVNFSCLQTYESFFSRRLYVGLNQSVNTIKSVVFAKGQERTGLGMTSYTSLVGIVLTWLGFAFKTTDAQGNKLYINKKSFCHLLVRLRQNNQNYPFFNPDYVDEEYKQKKISKEKAQKVYQIFDRFFSHFSEKNVGEVSISMLNKMDQID